MPEEKSPANRAMAAQIRAEASAEKISQKQLAELSGVNFETMKRIINGTRDINVTQITQIAAALNMPPALLVKRADERLARMSQGADILNFPRPDATGEIDMYPGAKAALEYDESATEPEDD